MAGDRGLSSAEFAHRTHTSSEVLQLARSAISLGSEYDRILKSWGGKPRLCLLLQPVDYVFIQEEEPMPAEFQADCSSWTAPKDWLKWLGKVRDYLMQAHQYYASRNQLAAWTCFGLPDHHYRRVEGGRRTIEFFNRHIGMFVRELNASDPKAALRMRLEAGELSKLLREARKKAGLTQQKAADRCGIESLDTYKSVESGRNKKPRVNNLQKYTSFVLEVLLPPE